MNKGRLVIVSGLSGAGKGTIVKRLLEKYPDQYVLSVSATTRAPRSGEREGVEYFFKTREEFEEMIREGRLLEHACYVKNYYGTPKDWVLEQIEKDKNVILEIELQGAMQVKELMSDAKLVFILPPSMEELKRRLEGRGTETAEAIEERLARAEEELKYVDKYDNTIINEDIEKSVEMLHNMIQTPKV